VLSGGEVAQWAKELQRGIAAAVAHRDAIQAQINALDAEEQAEQRRAAQRQADERGAEAEAQRLEDWRNLLPGGDT
jgi:predicted kinase